MVGHPSLLNMPDCAGRVQCEVAGSLREHIPAALARIINSYPDSSTKITNDMIRPAAKKGELAAAAFLPRDTKEGGVGVVGKLLSVWWEEGLEGLLSLSTSSLGRNLLALWRLPWSVQSSLYPHMRLSAIEMVAKYSSSGDWSKDPVRCLAWHPHTPKLALALKDDTVKIYPASSPVPSVQPVLKHASMRGVSCLAWRPLSGGYLAVGCLQGVMLWTVDPSSVVSRPSSSCASLLSRPGHSPVTGLSWAPDGALLASSSPSDTNLLIWSAARGECSPLRRVGGGGVTLVHWSQDSSRLFTATPGGIFRVWESSTWGCERWTVGSGSAEARVAAAAWSPDSTQVIFATTEEPVLYSLAFTQGGEAAVPLLDVSKVCLPDDRLCGGIVQALAWDPTGHRLAVAFRDTSLVCLLGSGRATTPAPLTPLGWVGGESEEERPSCLQFQTSTFHPGALLTIAWSSGRVQHLPLVFNDRAHKDLTFAGDIHETQLFSVD